MTGLPVIYKNLKGKYYEIRKKSNNSRHNAQ